MKRQSTSSREALKGWVIGSVTVAAVVAFIVQGGPSSLLSGYSFSQEVYDRQGRLLRLTTAEDEHFRAYVPLSDISPELIEGVLFFEDRYFRYHPGVNPVALVEAAVETYLLGRKRRGASTITMQLARLHFGIDSRSPWGKLKQIVAAVRLEARYTKDEILEAYFNLAPYGGNVVGVRAASLIYFGKQPSALTLAESLLLGVIPQNPNRRRPTSQGVEPDELRRARVRIARVYAEQHPDVSRAELGLTHPLEMRPATGIPFAAPHATTDLLQREKRAGKIETTIDLRLQRRIERRVASYIERHRSRGVDNGAAMLVDHRTMEVLALVGSADFHNPAIDGQVSAARFRRSPGSTLKPFVYARAIDQGLIHPGSLIEDAPASFADYTPHNFDGQFRGPLSATEALVRSRNIPALKLAARLDQGGLYGLLKAAGVKQLRPAGDYGLPVVLGGVELTMAELVGLYGMLPAGGMYRPVTYVRQTAEQSRRSGVRLISAEAGFLVLDMLGQNPRPGQHFSNEWISGPARVAWKTGTSPGSRDAWSIGVFGPYVLAVWVGRFPGGESPAYVGRETAAPLFFDIVDGLRPFSAGEGTENPALNISRVAVCAVSGMVPGPHCPHRIDSWFIPGTSPIARCDIHREVAIDTRTGERSCTGDEPHLRREVFEFWPSDLARLFRDAGLPRRAPPPFKAECRQPVASGHSSTLAITSPKRGIVYSLRSSEVDDQLIAFRATSDADASRLYWFVDQKLVGRTAPGKTLFWRAGPGTFEVRVIDQLGRTDHRPLAVEVVE